MFGTRLKELRKKNGYTQVTLAEKLGKWSTEDELMDLIKLYLSIDDYGNQTVDYLIKTEAERCRNQGTSEDVSGIDIMVTFRS